MPTWKIHKKWARRFLENGKRADLEKEVSNLITFPIDRNFLLTGHDFNRRPWRDSGNRAIAFNVFGRKGLQLMDLHYCLDFLKEKTDPEIAKQKWMMMRPTGEEYWDFQFYPSTRRFAESLAGRVEPLNINIDVFKFVIVNFKELLGDVVLEHGIYPQEIRGWDDFTFNNMIEGLKNVG